MEVKPSPLVEIFATRQPPVSGIKFIAPRASVDANACETVLQIGLFFDGTGNNREYDLPNLAHSNVARLYDAYVAEASKGRYKFYMPGLGTPFPEIGEYVQTTFGSAFARGGEGRILYALLSVLNAISQCAFASNLFTADQIKAICQTSSPSKNEKKLLADLGQADGILGDARRRGFLEDCGDEIERKLKVRGKPKISELIVDVFGFSRGAAEARVFCHWLREVLRNKKIAGIPCRFRFVGLMDTVASVGVWESVKHLLNGRTGGHGDWARPESLRISPEVENCVHQVAMHELRLNFPLDRVLTGDVLPPNCQEFVYPGAHSDVGGGYAPGELGVSVGATKEEGDSLKLSQIPLHHMFECAVAAGVPLSRNHAGSKRCRAPFAIHSKLEQAYSKFLDISTEQPRLLGDWAFPYLAWRWQMGSEFANSGQVRKSANAERAYLLAANKEFQSNAELIKANGKLKKSSEFWKKSRTDSSFDIRDGLYFQEDLSWLEPEAPELYARVTRLPKTVPELAAFFDDFVHDSLAGFRKAFVEKTSYWRYRRVFRGSAQPVLG